MAGFIVRGQELASPDGLSVVNFRMAGVPSLRNCARPKGDVTEVVIHETVTSSAKSTVAVLQQRGLGVHLIVGADGMVYQHADLQDDETWHASEHNGASVGIETVNPWEAKYRPNNSPWVNTIKAGWANNEDYVVPTPEQSEALALLVNWLTSPDSTLAIPRTWVGLADKLLMLGHEPTSALGPGIYAHHYFHESHLDGPWLLLYCWLRLEAQLDPVTAYSEALKRAPGKVQVDLSDLFAASS